MSDLSTYLKNGLRNHVFRTDSYTKPSALYISLHVSNPGLTGTGEVSGGSYARVQRNPLDANWSIDGDGGVQNAADVEFPSPTANWGTASYAGVWDASTGGNFLGKALLQNAKIINSGDPAPKFAVGDLKFKFE